MRAFFALLAFAGALMAQQPDWFASVHADLTNLKYPEEARVARIQGRCSLVVRPHPDGTFDITEVSGHRLFVPSIATNVRQWRFVPALKHPITVRFNFMFTEHDPIMLTRKVSGQVLRSDVVGRFFLRLLNRPTYRNVEFEERYCDVNKETVVSGPASGGSESFTVTVSVTTDMPNCPQSSSRAAD